MTIAVEQQNGSVQVQLGSAEAQWRLFFWVGIPVFSIAAALLTKQSSSAATILVAMAVAAAAASGMALYRTLWPLCAPEPPEMPQMVQGRTVAALTREKTLVLRSIKELQFDRNMGKVSEADFDMMLANLRGRAVRLIRQLEGAPSAYRTLIEQELGKRLAQAAAEPAVLPSSPSTPAAPQAAPVPPQETPVAPLTSRVCRECSTPNDQDAHFCKECGRGFEPICSGCHATNDLGARFCNQCGTRLEAAAEMRRP